ncbi:hypothetical protein C1645_748422, partial [Glomus cerebriforme]
MTTLFKSKTKRNIPSTRGKSLEDDFRLLLNDERSFDISLKCSDGVTLRACKSILATRSDVFNNLIFNKSKEEIKIIKFNKINSIVMKAVLEFLYTSNIKKVDLTIKDFIEMYYAANCFKLDELQKDIIEFTNKILDGREDKDLGKQLLSQYVEIFSIKSYNGMSKLLIDFVAKFKLNPLQDDSLSLYGLRYLLSKTFEIQIPFATPEFELFKYTLNKVKRTIIKDYLPNKDSTFNMDYEPNIVKEIQKHLKPFLPYFDLHRMEFICIMKYVEPLNVFPSERILDVYRYKVDENISQKISNDSRLIRGVPIFRWQAYQERIIELTYGFQISKDGFTLEVCNMNNSIKSMIADMIIKGKGVYEWDIVIEKLHKTIWIGICDYDKTLEDDVIIYIQGYHGWVLGSDGYIYHKKDRKWYGAELKEGDIVTVHLDMTEKSFAFSVNGDKYPIFSEWKITTSKVIPVVSLRQGSRLRIQPHLNELP